MHFSIANETWIVNICLVLYPVISICFAKVQMVLNCPISFGILKSLHPRKLVKLLFQLSARNYADLANDLEVVLLDLF